MSEQIHDSAFLDGDVGKAEAITEVRREAALLKTGALQNAIFNSANFSSIATDEKGVIQLFNVGAERMLGYAAADVMNKITPAGISDPQELIARARNRESFTCPWRIRKSSHKRIGPGSPVRYRHTMTYWLR